MGKTANILVGIVLVLLALGVVMLASTSAVQAQTHFGDPNYYLKRQGLWMCLALVGLLFSARVPYQFWRRAALPLTLVTLVLLALVLVPGIGHSVNGSRRWLFVGQPSELAKLAVITLLAWWMARIQRHAGTLGLGLLTPLAGLGPLLLLVFVEPDFGTTFLMALTGMLIMFVGGSRLSHLAVAASLGGVGFALMIMQNALRMRRILAFLDPEKYAKKEAFQLLQAIYAFVVGGVSGVGLGQSLQKQFWLPESHTDFIFAIIGEELGMAGSLGVVALFVGFMLCGVRISFRAPDTFGKLLGFGATMMLSLQAAINIAVVTGSMPTKGLALPFISYGGSSLIISLLLVGILVNIARQADQPGADPDARFIKDNTHRF